MEDLDQEVVAKDSCLVLSNPSKRRERADTGSGFSLENLDLEVILIPKMQSQCLASQACVTEGDGETSSWCLWSGSEEHRLSDMVLWGFLDLFIRISNMLPWGL
ncbi:hypothetical protein AMTR_s00044p00226890, partial [Amborella trichopoda]